MPCQARCARATIFQPCPARRRRSSPWRWRSRVVPSCSPRPRQVSRRTIRSTNELPANPLRARRRKETTSRARSPRRRRSPPLRSRTNPLPSPSPPATKAAMKKRAKAICTRSPAWRATPRTASARACSAAISSSDIASRSRRWAATTRPTRCRPRTATAARSRSTRPRTSAWSCWSRARRSSSGSRSRSTPSIRSATSSPAFQGIASLLWSPIHAKFKFTESTIIHGDIFALAGAGRTFHESVLGLTWEAGLGLKLYFSRFVTFRLDVRDFLIPQEVLGRGRSTNNITILGGFSLWLG